MSFLDHSFSRCQSSDSLLEDLCKDLNIPQTPNSLLPGSLETTTLADTDRSVSTPTIDTILQQGNFGYVFDTCIAAEICEPLQDEYFSLTNPQDKRFTADGAEFLSSTVMSVNQTEAECDISCSSSVQEDSSVSKKRKIRMKRKVKEIKQTASSTRKRARDKEYFAAASRKAREKKKSEINSLTEINQRLEAEQQAFISQISALKGEIEQLADVNSNPRSNGQSRRFQKENQVLRHEIQKYKQLKANFLRFVHSFETVNIISSRAALMNKNLNFMFDKLLSLMYRSSKVRAYPCSQISQQSIKFGQVDMKEMMKKVRNKIIKESLSEVRSFVQLQLADARAAGLLSPESLNPENIDNVFHKAEEFKFDVRKLNGKLRFHEGADGSRIFRIDVQNFPVPKDILFKIWKFVDNLKWMPVVFKEHSLILDRDKLVPGGSAKQLTSRFPSASLAPSVSVSCVVMFCSGKV